MVSFLANTSFLVAKKADKEGAAVEKEAEKAKAPKEPEPFEFSANMPAMSAQDL